MEWSELKAALLGPLEVRKTVAQKDAFIAWVTRYAADLGVETTVEESGRFVRTRNIVFGDVRRAKTLITAHYDTARLPFPNVMTPACMPLIVLTVLLGLAIFLPIGYGAGFGMGRLMRGTGIPPLAAALLAMLGSALLMAGIVWLMLAGPANPHTANDNTSGVAMVLLAMAAFHHRPDVAFVLFDNEEKGLLGAAAFAKAHPAAAKRAFLVQYDCVSDGGTLLYAGSRAGVGSPEGKRMAQALERCAPAYNRRTLVGASPRVFYPSDQMAFARGTAFAALRGRRVLYLSRIHTAKDTVFDEDNLRCLMDVLHGYFGEG